MNPRRERGESEKSMQRKTLVKTGYASTVVASAVALYGVLFTDGELAFLKAISAAIILVLLGIGSFMFAMLASKGE